MNANYFKIFIYKKSSRSTAKRVIVLATYDNFLSFLDDAEYLRARTEKRRCSTFADFSYNRVCGESTVFATLPIDCEKLDEIVTHFSSIKK